MREKLATFAVLMLFGCQCGARSKPRAARAPSNVIDAREIVNATGTAAPYAPVIEPPQQDEREQDRRPVSGGAPAREPEPPASPEDDPPIPTTGPFAEEAPPEEREVPADWPDAGADPPPEASGPLQDAGDPLAYPDAHGG